MDERLACEPNGRFIVRPHHDVTILTGLRLIVFANLLDRYFDTDLANVQLLGLEFRNQVTEYEQIHNFIEKALKPQRSFDLSGPRPRLLIFAYVQRPISTPRPPAASTGSVPLTGPWSPSE